MCLLIIVICFPILSVSQNLLPDGGFENAKSLPKWESINGWQSCHDYMALEDWTEVVRGTYQARFYHPKIVDWRTWNLGVQSKIRQTCTWPSFGAKSGLGSVGIYTYPEKHPRGISRYTRSYIQTKLITPLKKEEVYHFEMWVRTSNRSSMYFSSGLGVLLTDTAQHYSIKTLTEHYYIGATPQIFCDSTISNVDSWQKIEAYYIAKGGEQYLTIGNFFSNEKTTWIANQDCPGPCDPDFDRSLVFIDDIKIEQESPFDKLLEKKMIELPNITFNSGSEKLKESSKPMLRSFALFLKNNKTINVTITGHTDNVGNTSDNLLLSQKRAEEIKKYLVSQKVSSSQIETEGKGSSEPITNNDSSQGRVKNRRVEVEIIK